LLEALERGATLAGGSADLKLPPSERNILHCENTGSGHDSLLCIATSGSFILEDPRPNAGALLAWISTGL
jgi:hypothetical protein